MKSLRHKMQTINTASAMQERGVGGYPPWCHLFLHTQNTFEKLRIRATLVCVCAVLTPDGGVSQPYAFFSSQHIVYCLSLFFSADEKKYSASHLVKWPQRQSNSEFKLRDFRATKAARLFYSKFYLKGWCDLSCCKAGCRPFSISMAGTSRDTYQVKGATKEKNWSLPPKRSSRHSAMWSFVQSKASSLGAIDNETKVDVWKYAIPSQVK